MAKAVKETPWWLLADIEICEVCKGRYAFGTGRRCESCDAAICIHCVVIRKKCVSCGCKEEKG